MPLNSITFFLALALALALALVGSGYYFALGPGKKTTAAEPATRQCALPTPDRVKENMAWIPAGSFTMGAAGHYPEEGPVHKVSLDGFWMDKYEVTNAQFARFVDATGYVTVAERQPDPDDFPDIAAQDLQAGSVVFIMPTEFVNGGSLTQWWQFIPGANWREPAGPGSHLADKEHHPVVHVAYEDALAYANWLGHDLPTEAQWEYAARSGLERQTYSWGEEFTPADTWRANIWQGLFPLNNSKEDGHVGSAPVACYPENAYGLHDMTGNVWEWVASWYYPRHQVEQTIVHGQPKKGYDPRQPGLPVKVIKGGSYLCAENYCMRYRPAARHAQETTLGAAHIGFRTVKNE